MTPKFRLDPRWILTVPSTRVMDTGHTTLRVLEGRVLSARYRGALYAGTARALRARGAGGGAQRYAPNYASVCVRKDIYMLHGRSGTSKGR